MSDRVGTTDVLLFSDEDLREMLDIDDHPIESLTVTYDGVIAMWRFKVVWGDE